MEQVDFKAHKALREREPQRTLVIGSNKWQSTWTFKYLRVPEGDKNIILSFHYYEPQALTHYGAHWTPVGSYRGKLTYPGQLISQADYDAAPDNLKPILKQYTSVWNRDRIAQDFRDAIDVAKNTACSSIVENGAFMSRLTETWLISGQEICCGCSTSTT